MDLAMRATYGLTLAGFEKRWRQSTRRRYGALALVQRRRIWRAAIAHRARVPLYVARRQRDRRRMAAMVAADEAAERAARSSAIEALLRGDDGPDFGDDASPTHIRAILIAP